MSSLFGLRNKTAVQNLDSKTFEEGYKSDENSVLLDVRTPQEHEDRHIPNSILIDIMSPDFQEQIEKLDKSKSYYVYCRSGNRSYHAARMMQNIGIEKVYNLADGMIGWYGPVE